MSDQAIGLFDSGVGGLSVYQELTRQLPNEQVVYFADTLHMPYGSRSPEELRQLVFAILGFLAQQNVKLVIMACNTSSALTLELARQHFPMPILGMIQPTARALAAGNHSRLGVIGTEATIRSNKYHDELRLAGFAGDTYNQACPELASLIESGTDEGRLRQVIGQYLKPLQEAGVEKLILGCTHYPFASCLIETALNGAAELVNPATFVVQEAKQLLTEMHLLRSSEAETRHLFFTSGSVIQFESRAALLMGYQVQARPAFFRTKHGVLQVED